MPRYRFHLRSQDRLVGDDEGVDLPNLWVIHGAMNAVNKAVRDDLDRSTQPYRGREALDDRDR
jgi:hypothetical protein